MELPTSKTPAIRKSPRDLVIYGPPKIGKTTLLSQLENCLILDLEEGTDMLEALKIKVNSLAELGEAGKAIIQAGKPYKYVAIDTITQLEEWCEEDATQMYLKSNMGQNYWKKNPNKPSVLALPNGAGYLWLRNSYKKYLKNLRKLADHVILVGHLKDKFIEDKKGNEVAIKDIDLTGKIKQITCVKADAIGYVFREKGQTMISFETKDLAAGSRSEHLAGKTMPLDWSQIFID